MELNYEPFLDRSSIFGEVRWPRADGKAVNGSAASGLKIAYEFAVPTGDFFPRHVVKHPQTWDASTEAEYIVRFWGLGIVEPAAPEHYVTVAFAPGVQWERSAGPDAGFFRYVDRTFTQFQSPQRTIHKIEPFHVRIRRVHLSELLDISSVLVGG